MLVTNDVTRDARVQKEAVALSEAGADVTVVGMGCSTGWQHDTIGVRLVQPPTPSTSRLWPLRVATNLMRERRFEQQMAGMAMELKPDIIHANDLDTLRSAFVAADHRAPVVYDAHEISTEGGVLPWWKRWLWTRREMKLAPRAARVITVNRHIAEWLHSKYRLSQMPGVVMNGPSECRVSGDRRPGPIRLLFQGQYFADRNLPALVNAVEPLAGSVVLTFQGWGEEEAKLRDMVHRLCLEQTVRFVPPCRPQDTVLEASAHDVGLIVHKASNLNHVYASPNKLFDYLGAGLAIVSSDFPVLRDIVIGNHAGLVFDPERPEALTDALRCLIETPALLDGLKAGARDACAALAWEAQRAVLLSEYASVAASMGS